MRCNLFTEWASFKKMFKFQPIDAVRDYYGVKVALYFAWLGFYTSMLVIPSIVGLFVFLYGVATMNSDVPSMDICDSTEKICPACDFFCDYWDVAHDRPRNHDCPLSHKLQDPSSIS